MLHCNAWRSDANANAAPTFLATRDRTLHVVEANSPFIIPQTAMSPLASLDTPEAFLVESSLEELCSILAFVKCCASQVNTIGASTFSNNLERCRSLCGTLLR